MLRRSLRLLVVALSLPAAAGHATVLPTGLRRYEQGVCGASDPHAVGVRIEPAPRGERPQGLHVHDAFGPTRLDVRERAELCVPSYDAPAADLAW